MEQVSVVHWLIVIVFVAITAIPTITILHRAGRSGWWCILTYIPFLNLVALWLFAFTRWPRVDGPTSRDMPRP